jgi:hypothetical protein
VNAPWLKPFRIEELDDNWNKMPSTPGVYIIFSKKRLQRVGGVEPAGILYVGKSGILRNRLWQFWDARHPASGLLWDHPKVASKIFGKKLTRKKDVDPFLGNLIVRVATPIRGKRKLEAAEKALLFAYMNRFGELPPLNFSLPGHWDKAPGRRELRWAEEGLWGGSRKRNK